MFGSHVLSVSGSIWGKTGLQLALSLGACVVVLVGSWVVVVMVLVVVVVVVVVVAVAVVVVVVVGVVVVVVVVVVWLLWLLWLFVVVVVVVVWLCGCLCVSVQAHARMHRIRGCQTPRDKSRTSAPPGGTAQPCTCVQGSNKTRSMPHLPVVRTHVGAETNSKDTVVDVRTACRGEHAS